MQPVRDPILTRSRAAAAQSGDGSGFRPATVKEEPVELPTPADNGDGSSSEPCSAKGQGVSWSLGGPLARWFSIEKDSDDEMEGSSMGGGPAKMVKFTGSNRIMTVSELRNLAYQKTLAVGSKRSQSADTQTHVEKFGVLRECCNGEARVLLNDHFQARIDRNRELYEAVEAVNLQLETQTRAAWQRAYDAYTAELAAREQAQAQAQTQAARAAAPTAAPGAGADGAPPPPPPPVPASGVAPTALPPFHPPVHHVPPKKPPPDDPTILTDAYALLERTFPEVTPEVHKRYLYFKHTPGKTTIMTLHDLREPCRLTKNPTEGHFVVEKAINAVLDQLRKVLEAETIQWTGSQLTLDYLEARARAIDEALQVRELERAPLELAKAAAAKSLGQLQLKEEGKAQDNSARSSKRPREERRRQNRGNKREEAFAVTAAPANGKSGFKGKCYTYGQEGHVKAGFSQKPKDGAMSGRKLGTVCSFCHKWDSHRENECWEKHPKKKPEKWRKMDKGGAEQAYAAGAEPGAPEAEPAWDPYMTWGVSVQPRGRALDAFAIFTEEGPKLRATTHEQRDTTAAARAKGKAARAATRAKEERGRVGGPPPGFKPKGERTPPAAEDAGQPAPAGRRRQAPKAAAASPARATRIPPGFKEYGPNDPRYQGLTDAEQVGVRVELLEPPKTGPVTSNVVRRRGGHPVVALSAFYADVLPVEEAQAAGGAVGGAGGGPANIPPSEDMGGEQMLDWEAEHEQRRVNARNQNHEGELDVSLEIREKPPTLLEHTGDRVPWRPSYPLPHRGAVYVRNFLTEVDRSRRKGRGPNHESHATRAGILPKRSNRRQGSWSDLHKQQRQGFLCHLGREWVATYHNLPNEETGEPRFMEDKRTYRLKAMQHLVADLGRAYYARVPNQPDLRETRTFHERLVLPPSQQGRSKVTRDSR
jgi:hypothetical protein